MTNKLTKTLSIVCPQCDAPIGQPCTRLVAIPGFVKRYKLYRPHSARITAADTEERRREEYHAMHHETHPLDFSASDPKV